MSRLVIACLVFAASLIGAAAHAQSDWPKNPVRVNSAMLR